MTGGLIQARCIARAKRCADEIVTATIQPGYPGDSIGLGRTLGHGDGVSAAHEQLGQIGVPGRLACVQVGAVGAGERDRCAELIVG